MSALYLTKAVNAAAEYQFGIDAALLGIDAERLGQAWDDAKPAVKHAYRESVRGAVAAAAPVIEGQVREQIAKEIEADLHSPGRCVSPAIRYGYEGAARIARGDS